MKRIFKIRLAFPLILLLLIWATQTFPGWGEFYARRIYPSISYVLGSFSSLFPFAIGDLFIFLSILFLLFIPIYGGIKKIGWKTILARMVEFLVWIYIWFYLAWGLNYSQDHFYKRTGIPYSAYSADNFTTFLEDYIPRLNESYVPAIEVDRDLLQQEVVHGYSLIGDSLGINPLRLASPRVKTMLFTPLISKVGVIGSMGPFFCEFTVNGDALPSQYPATYAHELSHLMGITSEAEANLYAYQVCTLSEVPEIRFAGYFSILNHVLNNAYRLLPSEEFDRLKDSIRPEIKELSNSNREYWMAKYSPIIGEMQSWIYDLYLKGNKIESGRKNYSEVIGLLISYQNRNNQKDNNKQ